MPRIKNQTITSEAREVISNIIKVVDLEARVNNLQYPLHSRNKRAACYANVSITSIQRIRKENNERKLMNPMEKLKTPGKRKKKQKLEDKYDDVDFQKIRDVIEEFYFTHKKSPTIEKLLECVREKLDFSHNRTSFYKLLKLKGFIWKKFGKKPYILMEQPELINERYKFLSALKNYRNENRSIIYINKTCVPTDILNNKTNTFPDNSGIQTEDRRKMANSIDQLIIILAASSDGLIKNAQLVIKSENCQNLISKKNFERWISEYLLPNIPERSIIVMYNSPYFSNDAPKTPDKFSTKRYLLEWLENHKILFDASKRKPELLNLVSLHTSNEHNPKTNSVEEIFITSGHTLLYLPSYLSELNPLKFAWKNIKDFIQQKIISYCPINDPIALIYNSIEMITIEKWKSYMKLTSELENKFWVNDEKMEIVLDEIISNLKESNNVEDSEGSVEEANDDDMSFEEDLDDTIMWNGQSLTLLH